MVMVFTLVSAAQDKLVELIESIKKMQQQEKQRKEEELKRQEEVDTTHTAGFVSYTYMSNYLTYSK